MTSERTVTVLRRAGVPEHVFRRLVRQGLLDGLELTERRLRIRLLNGHLGACTELLTERRVTER
jgi:hypothetical protein